MNKNELEEQATVGSYGVILGADNPSHEHSLTKLASMFACQQTPPGTATRGAQAGDRRQ